jgi:alkylated DNA repair dioxygenase AlkB
MFPLCFTDPHVDSVKFSGGIVSGLSLLSTRLMSLAPDHDCDNFKNASTREDVDSPRTPYYCLRNLPPTAETLYKHDDFKDTDECFEGSIELLLPRRSLYILSGPLRYTFTHRIFGIAGAPKLITEEILHERRLSIIFRDELQPPIL